MGINIGGALKGAVGGFVGSGGNPLGALMGGLGGLGSGGAGRGIQGGMRMNAEQQKKAMESINQGSDRGLGYLQAGAGAARSAYGDAYGQSQGAINQGYGQGYDRLQAGNQGAMNALNPMANMFDPSMGNQFSIGGMGQNLAQFSDPNGAFSGVFDSRQRAAGSALAGAGYSRAGTAAASAANIDMETALGLNSQLFQQQMQNPAFAAMQQQSGLMNEFGQQGAQMSVNQGGQLSSLATGYGSQMGGLETGLASDQAQLELGRGSNLANLQSGLGASQAAGMQALGEANASDNAGFMDMINTGIGSIPKGSLFG